MKSQRKRTLYASSRLHTTYAHCDPAGDRAQRPVNVIVNVRSTVRSRSSSFPPLTIGAMNLNACHTHPLLTTPVYDGQLCPCRP